MGVAALLGLGLAGAETLAAVDRGKPDNSAVTADEQSRAEAARRADRSARGSGSPAAPSSSPPSPATAAPGQNKNAVPAIPAKPAKPKPPPKPAWVSPMPGAETTSCFGPRWGVMHAGIDLAMPENTPIHAAGAGRVISDGWAYPGYGISVMIDHGNGYLTHYAHMNKSNVEMGQNVDAGDVIGWEGSTGDSTGPHLHFEVHNGGLWNQINPAPWMRERGVDLGC